MSLLFPIYQMGMREAKDFSQISWTVGCEAKTCSPVSPVLKPLSSADYMADASLILRVLGVVIALGRKGVKWGREEEKEQVRSLGVPQQPLTHQDWWIPSQALVWKSWQGRRAPRLVSSGSQELVLLPLHFPSAVQ